MALTMLYFIVCIWSDRPEQTMYPDKMPQMRQLIRVYTVCHIQLFLVKYGEDLRCLNTKGKYVKVTNTEIK